MSSISPTHRTLRRELLFLIAVVILAMTVRAAFTALPRVVRWDEAAYQLIARSLLAGEGYDEVVGARDLQQPPVVAYLSVAGRGLGLPIPWATATFSLILLGGLIPIPVYLLGRDLKSRRIGALAALLVAIHPALAVSPLYWSTMTEPPYALFMLCGVYAAWRAARGGAWRWFGGMGLCFGLAYLTRPEALAYLLAMLAFVLLWRGVTAWRERRAMRLLGQLAAGLAVFSLVCAPYIVYVHRVTGRWALSGKQGVTMDISWAYAQRSQAEHDRVTASLDRSGKEIVWLSAEAYDTSLLDWIRADPARFATLFRHNIGALFSALFEEDLFRPWQVALIALGLFATAWSRRRAGRELLLIFALAPTLSLLLFFVLSRFLPYVVAIGMIWAAEGLDALMMWTQLTGDAISPDGVSAWRGLFSALPALIAAAAMTLLLVEGGGVAMRERPRQPFDRVLTAQWLAANVPPGSPVMTRNSEIPLYAGLPQVAFPKAPWEQVRAYGEARGARYVVIEDREITSLRPELSPLLNETLIQPFPGLTRLKRLDNGKRDALIFELK